MILIMSWFLFALILIISIIVYNNYIEQLSINNKNLSVFIREDRTEYFTNWMMISFSDMLMLSYSSCTDYPGWSKIELYHVKRFNGEFYIKYHPESLNKKIKYLENLKDDELFFSDRENKQQVINNLIINEWVNISSSFPEIESRYQLWLTKCTSPKSYIKNDLQYYEAMIKSHESRT